MHKLETIAEQIRELFETQTAARDRALSQARSLTRHCALAIRAVHRDELTVMNEHLQAAQELASQLNDDLQEHLDLYYTGYTQDALKEYAEAQITCALIKNQPLPTFEELGVIHPTYLKGLAEAVGEFRRRILDILRHGYSEEAERLLSHMDDIYAILVTMDFPDAITNGLRRQTDITRSLIERTRGDITFSLRGEYLEKSIQQLSRQLLSEEVIENAKLFVQDKDNDA